jgi:hypothetical protein
MAPRRLLHVGASLYCLFVLATSPSPFHGDQVESNFEREGMHR